jgi:hypothetical protein
MLSPIALATWISICIPWAEPRLAAALAHAGSANNPYQITERDKPTLTPEKQGDASKLLQARLTQSPTSSNSQSPELFIGLTQIPLSSLRELNIDPLVALDVCANLEIGYSLFLEAHALAAAKESNPWKRTALAYNYYREREKRYESPYFDKVKDFLSNSPYIQPAHFGSSLHHAILAQSSAGLSTRHAIRTTIGSPSVLLASRQLVDQTRLRY